MPRKKDDRLLDASQDYAREDSALRGIFLGSSGLVDEDAIRAHTGCNPCDALRVAMLRHAGGRVVAAWIDRRLSYRQLARIVLIDAPGDDERQVALARRIPSAARYLDSPMPSVGPGNVPAELRRVK